MVVAAFAFTAARNISFNAGALLRWLAWKSAVPFYSLRTSEKEKKYSPGFFICCTPSPPPPAFYLRLADGLLGSHCSMLSCVGPPVTVTIQQADLEKGLIELTAPEVGKLRGK